MKSETSTYRILHAEDRETFRFLVKTYFSLAGYDVVSVSSGEEAIDFLAADNSSSIDILITDNRMPPGITGLELVKKVREENSHLPIIIYTGTPMDVALQAEEFNYKVVPKEGQMNTLYNNVRRFLPK